MHGKFTLVVAVTGSLLVSACHEPPAAPTSEGAAFAVARAERPVVTVNAHGKGDRVPQTIQEGVDLVRSGGRVQVMPGTYSEAVLIDKGVTIQAIGQDPVILRPVANAAAIEVTASDPVAIRGLVIDSEGEWGVFGEGPVDVTIEATTVLNAEIGAMVVNSIASSGKRARLVVRNSTFDGGSVPTTATSVFAVTDVDALIEGIVVRRALISCIQVQGSANADVIGNDVDECGKSAGINAPMDAGGSVVNIVDNRIRNSGKSNSQRGIYISHATGRIERNTVVDYVQPDADEMQSAGIFVSWDAKPVVRFNDISGNAHAGLKALRPVDLDVTCNWWGSPDGPSGNGPGNGDAVIVIEGSVSLVPFATTPIAHTAQTSCSGGM